MYSKPDLLIPNLLIGMCRGSAGLPRLLRDLGYRDRWIPRCFPDQDGDSVPPVFAVTSSRARHTMFVEICSGPEIDGRQLARYSKVTAAYLRSETSLSREQTETYDIAVFGLDRHRESLVEGLKAARHRFPLLLLAPNGLVLGANAFAKPALTNVFFRPLEVRWSSVPRSWIPFNDRSDLAEVAEAVIPELVVRVLRGEARIEVVDLCAVHPLWAILGEPGQSRLRARVHAALAAATGHEFSGHFVLRGNVVELTAGAGALSTFRATARLRQFLRLQTLLLDRLSDGRAGVRQPELFGERDTPRE